MNLPYFDLISKHSKTFAIDPLLVAAIMTVESAADKYAARFEPKWSYFFNVEEFAQECDITQATERVFQATSIGLLQIMGSVIRELGWHGSIVEIFEPDLNIMYGCKKLNQISRRWPDLKDTIAAYNAGSPRRLKDGRYENYWYVNKVLEHLRLLEKTET